MAYAAMAKMMMQPTMESSSVMGFFGHWHVVCDVSDGFAVVGDPVLPHGVPERACDAPVGDGLSCGEVFFVPFV